MNAFEAAEKTVEQLICRRELEVLFNTQNKSPNKDATSPFRQPSYALL